LIIMGTKCSPTFPSIRDAGGGCHGGIYRWRRPPYVGLVLGVKKIWIPKQQKRAECFVVWPEKGRLFNWG